MRPVLKRILIVFLIGGLLLILAPAVVDNLRYVGYLSQRNASFPAGLSESTFSCRETWLDTMALHNSGGQPADATWQAFLSCGSDYLPLLHIVQPANRLLAENAAIQYPNNALVWFWLGEINIRNDPAKSLEDYQKGLSVDSSNAVGWCQLGQLMENSNRMQEAADSFMNCCQLGDPGLNGCWGAGNVYEKLGNNPAAIVAYSLSTSPVVLQRADELKKQSQP